MPTFAALGSTAVDHGSFVVEFTDKVHDMGLKLGIYSSAGTYTCAKQFGSLGFEQVDAQTWAEWGIDYVSECIPPLSP